MARDGWTEKPLKEVLNISRKNIKPENFDGETVPLYSIPGFDERKFPVQIEPSSVKSGKLIVSEGSILVSLLNPRIPRTGYARISGYCSTEFAVIHPTDEVDHSYLFYLLSGAEFNDYLTSAARGTTGSRTRATRENILDYVSLFPPLYKQRKIVSFMQALDQMIQAGDREIASAEQMRGDILNALLDPAEQSWEEVVLGERISITRRNVKPENFGSETVSLYSIPGFDDGEFPQETKSNSVKSAKLEVDKDSILISLLNPRIPRVSQAVIPGYCSTEFAVVQPEDGLDFDFLYYLFSGRKFSDYLTKASRGTTGSRTRAKREDILEYLASVPPLEEQEKIVEKMQTLDAYLESAKRSQEALNQVRQDALHALLSGDKDVRDLAEMFATDEDVA